ncbi:CBS domain-containing protein [Phaeodactylibacter luteus]|uniref:CBS domain-containing protein n=1 Tax=Phaeodactylibacter luteus TaxID=1564516 RepID=A0A5C6RLF7_9BACT|nr:CBS domain-containing protein [Phaeodactylibacter luteus]TXB62749.1 CBS domain-containing protein [Phaeodactylibacter luteus]
MMNEPISSIMTRKVVTVRPTDTLEAVKEILFFKHIHHIPVVEGHRLMGIITSYDLVRLGKCQDEYRSIKVGDVMTTKVATLSPDDKIGAAAEVFLENLFHGLPIVNEAKDLVGIITTHDILKYEFYKEYPNHKIYWQPA